MHAEMMLDVFRQRMHLERKIASANRIQKIEADRKFISKSRMHGFAQQRLRMREYQVNRWNFQCLISKAKQEAVLFGDAIEAPTIVRRVSVEVTCRLHPLAAPRRRIEERHDTKWSGQSVPESAPHSFPIRQLRSWRI